MNPGVHQSPHAHPNNPYAYGVADPSALLASSYGSDRSHSSPQTMPVANANHHASPGAYPAGMYADGTYGYSLDSGYDYGQGGYEVDYGMYGTPTPPPVVTGGMMGQNSSGGKVRSREER